MVDIDDREVAC